MSGIVLTSVILQCLSDAGLDFYEASEYFTGIFGVEFAHTFLKLIKYNFMFYWRTLAFKENL